MLPRMHRFAARVSDSLRVFGTALANQSLRRVLLSFAGFCTTEWGAWIAIMVWPTSAAARRARRPSRRPS